VTLQTVVQETAVPVIRPTQPRLIDQSLPEWARRSNPIVRRQLGIYWKVSAPDLPQIGRYYLYQLGLVGASIIAPFLITLMMPVATVSLVALPIAIVVYAVMLIRVALAASDSIVMEHRCQSLDLLRICPRPLHEMLFSKAAAAIWRHIETLGPVLVVATLCSLPILIILHDQWVGLVDQPLLMRLTVALALGSSIARVLLETVMVAAIGIAMGSLTSRRTTAALMTLLLVSAYFLAINLLRLPPWGISARIVMEILLPTVLPLLIIPLSFRLAIRTLERT
jgi:hypothetical protein